MSRHKSRKSMADRPVTRRYVMRIVQRARDDIIRTVIIATAAQEPEPLDAIPAERWQRVTGAAKTWTS